MAFLLGSGVLFESAQEASILLEKIHRAAFFMVRAVPQTIYGVPLSFSALLPPSLLWPSFSAFKIHVSVIFARHCHRRVRLCNDA